MNSQDNCAAKSILSVLFPRDAVEKHGWNWCMNTTWCKVVAIVGIVLGGLLLLSVVMWIVRVLWCGVTTALCCCCCVKQAADSAMDRDLEKQNFPPNYNPNYNQPPNMYYQPNRR